MIYDRLNSIQQQTIGNKLKGDLISKIEYFGIEFSDAPRCDAKLGRSDNVVIFHNMEWFFVVAKSITESIYFRSTRFFFYLERNYMRLQLQP